MYRYINIKPARVNVRELKWVYWRLDGELLANVIDKMRDNYHIQKYFPLPYLTLRLLNKSLTNQEICEI